METRSMIVHLIYSSMEATSVERKLRVFGFQVTRSEALNAFHPLEQSRVSVVNLRAVLAADIVIVPSPPGESMDVVASIGAAIGAGKPVHVVCDCDTVTGSGEWWMVDNAFSNTFLYHPLVRRYGSIEDLIKGIVG